MNGSTTAHDSATPISAPGNPASPGHASDVAPDLDLLRQPLRGATLVEASAGTGKTFSLVTLYARLVLGHGAATAASGAGEGVEPLHPRNILVLTFTRAATAELRDRIRERLASLAAALADTTADARTRVDPIGVALLDDVLAPGQIGLDPSASRDKIRSVALRRLEHAAQAMDEAAIFTIHGWARRRMLERAFSAGGSFDLQIENDQNAAIGGEVEAWWRAVFYAAADAIATHTSACSRDTLLESIDQSLFPKRATPEDLAKSLQKPIQDAIQKHLLHDDSATHDPLQTKARSGAIPGADALRSEDRSATTSAAGGNITTPRPDSRESRTGSAAVDDPLPAVIEIATPACTALESLARLWSASRDAITAYIAGLKGTISGTKYKNPERDAEHVGAWLRGTGERPDDKVLERMGLEKLSSSLNKAKSLPEPIPEAFAAMDCYREETAQLQQRLQASLCDWVAQRIIRERNRSGRWTHDDPLYRIYRALARDAALITALRQRYPVALVDEFQDTDDLQYRIFSLLYRAELESAAPPAAASVGNDTSMVTPASESQHAAQDTPMHAPPEVPASSTRCGLFLIGDPKQSIYAFRGADLDTYLKARVALEDRRRFLPENHRSTPCLVAAVNHVFETADRLQPQRAFARGDALPFQRVHAAKPQRGLYRDERRLAAFRIVHDDTIDVAAKSSNRIRRACAQEIAELLAAARIDDGGQRRAVRPGDIAVLVRSHAYAQAMQRELDRHGVVSVLLGQKSSVLETREATEVAALLRACLPDARETDWRRALTLPCFILDAPNLEALACDDEAFERMQSRFLHYASVWQRTGVMAMLRSVLVEYHATRDWQALDDGSRRLGRWLHLAELLQQREDAGTRGAALLRWLESGPSDEPTADDNEQQPDRLRIDRDDQQVRILTWHASKGLQYPLVFVPELARVDARDDLAEALRQTYVALTRAEVALWCGTSTPRHTKGQAVAHEGTLGHLLGSPPGCHDDNSAIDGLYAAMQTHWNDAATTEKTLGEQGCDAAIFELKRLKSGLASVPRPQTTSTPATAGDVADNDAPPRVARKARRAAWSVTSFSRLAHDVGSAPAAAGAAVDWIETSARDGAEIETFEESTDARPTSRPREDPPGLLQTGGQGGEQHFPRGARAGVVLHTLLEWAAHEGFEAVLAADARALRQRAERLLRRNGWESHLEATCDWLTRVLSTPLIAPRDPAGETASRHREVSPDLPPARQWTSMRPEWEFLFATERCPVAQLDAWLQRHVLPGRPRPALGAGMLRGLLKGFVDLLVEIDGRYFVIDYKSNDLARYALQENAPPVVGTDPAVYARPTLERAMLASRYDAQAAIYLLALHRHLRARLADYTPERHLGGALHWFLRGINTPGAGIWRLDDAHVTAGLADALDELDHLLEGRMA